MITSTLNQWQFVDGMGDDFSYEAAVALYNYYEELSDDIGEPIEFDRVAIRCDWYEYDTLAEAYRNHRYDYTYVEGEAREYFEENTTLIELDNGHVLIGAF